MKVFLKKMKNWYRQFAYLNPANNLQLKPAILSEEDLKDIVPYKEKFDWAELGLFLLEMLLAALIGAGIGLMFLLFR